MCLRAMYNVEICNEMHFICVGLITCLVIWAWYTECGLYFSQGSSGRLESTLPLLVCVCVTEIERERERVGVEREREREEERGREGEKEKRLVGAAFKEPPSSGVRFQHHGQLMVKAADLSSKTPKKGENKIFKNYTNDFTSKKATFVVTSY